MEQTSCRSQHYWSQSNDLCCIADNCDTNHISYISNYNFTYYKMFVGIITGLGLGLFHFPSILYKVIDHKDIEIVKYINP